MTTLTLTKGWLLRVSTGETFGAQTSRDTGSGAYGVEGGIVNHAGGRQRSYIVEGESGTLPIEFLEVSLANIVLLRSWEGELMLYRDWRGQGMYGAYYEVGQVVRPEPLVYNAKIQLNLLTFAEGI